MGAESDAGIDKLCRVSREKKNEPSEVLFQKQRHWRPDAVEPSKASVI
jgi:hypothetical protein